GVMPCTRPLAFPLPTFRFCSPTISYTTGGNRATLMTRTTYRRRQNGAVSLEVRIPFLHCRQRPLCRFVRVATVATVGIAALDRYGRGDEIKRVIPGLGRY